MLLLDLSSVVISSTVNLMQGEKDAVLDESLMRHITLSQLLHYKKKFHSYGHPILCCDGGNYWREMVFPLYKRQRKKARKDSILDWNRFFEIFEQLKVELKEFFPYALVEIPKVEGDDIIAVLTQQSPDPVMIVSSDKDMLQLQMTPKPVKQYSIKLKKEINLKTSEYDLLTHIIKGDPDDGIPNILSPDDIFMQDGVRQKSIFKKFIEEVRAYDNPLNAFDDDEVKKRFKRNRLLIDADYIPERIKERILTARTKAESTKKSRVYRYLVQHKMKLLVDKVGEF